MPSNRKSGWIPAGNRRISLGIVDAARNDWMLVCDRNLWSNGIDRRRMPQSGNQKTQFGQGATRSELELGLLHRLFATRQLR